MTNVNETWLEIAKTLTVGGKTRIPHDCGDGNALVVNSNPKGYSCYCHRCGHTDFVHKGQRSFKELMELREQEKLSAASIRGSVKLPPDFSLEIPPYPLLWLLKASITPYIARQNGIGWSERYQRIILPVYNEDKLVYYQARAVHDYQTIKYVNPSVDRSNIIFKTYKENEVDYSRVVLTEDILSAIRVSKFVPAASLLGTKISDEQALQIGRFKRVTTWLDSDLAGRQGSTKVRRTLSLVTNTDDILTKKDPKLLTNEELRQCLLV